jgi:hypothetical protein
MLPAVLYECDMWLEALMEEHRLRVFHNRELRRIFEPKSDKVTGDWRKLHMQVHNSRAYSSLNIIKMIK